MAQSTPKPYRNLEQNVGPGLTISVDTIPLECFNSLEYQLSVTNSDESLRKSLKLFVQKTDTDVEDTLFSKLGDPIQIEVSSEKVGQNLEIRVKNNEAYQLKANLLRLLN